MTENVVWWGWEVRRGLVLNAGTWTLLYGRQEAGEGHSGISVWEGTLTLMKYEILQVVAALSGEGNGTPLQYSCLENPMDGGTW